MLGNLGSSKSPRFCLLALGVLLALPWLSYAGATVIIVNLDDPGEGFNDPTPRTPVGGNPGTTLGQQRLNAFQHAANLWGAKLDSTVPIRVMSRFDPLLCFATSAVLGSAGPIAVARDFLNAEIPSTWYHIALANKLAGDDLSVGFDDILTRFNSNIGLPGCLTGVDWYYGLDNNHGLNIDLVTVVLHELGHGLGFSQFASLTSGALFLNLPDVYNTYIRDRTLGANWPALSNSQRVASAINSRKVNWQGVNVTKEVPGILALGVPQLRVLSPAAIAGGYDLGPAEFGPPLSSPGITGAVVQALDPADVLGPVTTDACSPLINASAVAGNIALVDRGTCTFTTKVKNAQNAGAIAVIIANNTASSPPAGLGGTDGTIVIPSGRITLADGDLIKAQLGAGVTARLGVDLSLRAGADNTGRALLNTPNPVQPGSSISHWDWIASPNQLMEPFISPDLTHKLDMVDMTLGLMKDIGWFSDFDGVPDGVDQCLGSDPSSTVVVGACNSGVPNTLFASGCKISDGLSLCKQSAKNHGEYLSCVSGITDTLKKNGVITGAQQGAITKCVGGSN